MRRATIYAALGLGASLIILGIILHFTIGGIRFF